MDNLFAFIIAIIALVYSEPITGGLLLGYLLPVIGVVSLYYMLRMIGSMIVASGIAIFYFMDISSPSLFYSVVLPIMLGFTVIIFGVWAWKQDHSPTGSSWADPGSSGGGLGGGDCGGDGGGC